MFHEHHLVCFLAVEFFIRGESFLLPHSVHTMALTVTATKEKRAKILSLLSMSSSRIISHKKNIAYSVRKKDTMKLIIIFCRRYEECAELYQLFRATQGRISLSHLLA